MKRIKFAAMIFSISSIFPGTILSQSIIFEKLGSFLSGYEHAFAPGASAQYFDTDKVIVLNRDHFSVYNNSGDLINSFGTQGRGPGDIGRAMSYSMSENENLLMVLDHQNRRISTFNPKEGSFVETYPIDYTVNALHGLYFWHDYVTITGNHQDNNALLHFHDKSSKEYEFSVGEFIDWDITGIQFVSRSIQNQLNSGKFAKTDQGYLLLLNAPYEIRHYSDEHTLLWESTDDVIPEPWVEHIEVTPNSYEVKFYPSLVDLRELNENYFFVHWYEPIPLEDRTQWSYYADLRDLNDGSLITRKKLPFLGQIRDLKALGVQTYQVIVQEGSNYGFDEYRMKIIEE
ncbi:6-bladed beta-propeller [Rhodohalobacter sp. SW132]|nr:6-bladed beta-propeller [Rhodohalobacter sp. SW132]